MLLAALIAADLTLFWRIVWRARDVMPDTSVALLTALIASGLYYFAAALIIRTTRRSARGSTAISSP